MFGLSHPFYLRTRIPGEHVHSQPDQYVHGQHQEEGVRGAQDIAQQRGVQLKKYEEMLCSGKIFFKKVLPEILLNLSPDSTLCFIIRVTFFENSSL